MDDGNVTIHLTMGRNGQREEVYIPEDYVLDPEWPDDGGWASPFGWRVKNLEDYDIVYN